MPIAYQFVRPLRRRFGPNRPEEKMTQDPDPPVVYDEAKLKQLEDDDPGITWFQTIKQTLPLVNGFRGKVRALSMAALRLLP